MKKKYSVISLFSGGMGLDIGLENTKRFETLACVEKVPAFCETIKKNRDSGRIGNKKMRVYAGDICSFDPKQIMKDLGLKRGDLDVLVGGPPCQSFSTAGKRGTIQDPRGTLLWQFLRFVQELQPKVFLMENVRGLMSAALKHRPIAERPEKGGKPFTWEEEPGSVVRKFLEDLHASYRIDCFEVNSVNYGAPQIRERALFFGNRYNYQVEFPDPTHSNLEVESCEQLDLFSTKRKNSLKPFVTLGESLKGLKEQEPVILDFSPRKKKYLSMIPPGGNWRCLPPEIARESMGRAFIAKGGRSGWWRRLSFDLPSPTIVTMPNHASTSLCHPTESRALSVLECARIQGFPDNWEFCGKVSEQYAQIGNAVPIRLGEVSGGVLSGTLDEIYLGKYQVSKNKYLPFRVVYLRSHVRTRKWFKNGKEVVWLDGKDNTKMEYGNPKTLRKVRKLDAAEGQK
jgi:DNA (cytosine-5)-methyltransferase 1